MPLLSSIYMPMCITNDPLVDLPNGTYQFCTEPAPQDWRDGAGTCLIFAKIDTTASGYYGYPHSENFICLDGEISQTDIFGTGMAISWAGDAWTDARLLTQFNLHSAPVIQSELIGILSVSDILDRSSAIEEPRELALADEIKALSEAAQAICEDNGPNSTACAEAWARVDVLQAELAHQQTKTLDQFASEQFYEEYPEAFRDREYDAWCSG